MTSSGIEPATFRLAGYYYYYYYYYYYELILLSSSSIEMRRHGKHDIIFPTSNIVPVSYGDLNKSVSEDVP
jgi:hypothetical protein